MARDWRPGEAAADPAYPRRVEAINVPVWPIEQAREFPRERIAAHKAQVPVPCTDSERWYRPGQTALMKHWQKRAVKLFDVRPDGPLPPGHYFEDRPGRYPRCELYCSVSHVCPIWTWERGVKEAA